MRKRNFVGFIKMGLVHYDLRLFCPKIAFQTEPSRERGMNPERDGRLTVVGDVVRQFGLTSLQPTLSACESLAGGGPIDVAVLGQFKSGKSSLLNAVLGEAVFPVGAVPVTAVVTRAAAGPERVVRVTYLDGSVEEVAPARIAEFVTESGNPGNRRRVAFVDVLTPALRDWPGMRLVDTPGLGSILAHNTEATRTWMPNVAVALVTVSAERPLSDEDRRLIAEAQQTAPRVVVLLTKVDLLTDHELKEVRAFVGRALRESFGAALLITRRVGAVGRSTPRGGPSAGGCERRRGAAGGAWNETRSPHRGLSGLPDGRLAGRRAGRRRPGTPPGRGVYGGGERGRDPGRIAAR